jgi:hypothetical protein
VTHITSIFDSKAAEHGALSLEGDSAQCFLDVIQEVSRVSIKSSLFNWILGTRPRTFDDTRAFSEGSSHNPQAL